MQKEPDASPGHGRWCELAIGLALGTLCLLVLLAVPRLPKGALAVDGDAILEGRLRDAPLVLAYFGFPGCTDTCPAALAELAALHRIAHDQRLSHVLEFAFVNIDPLADREALDAWLAGFDPAIVGYLPGPEGLALLERRLGLVLRPVAGPGASHADYFVLLRRDSEGDWQVIERSRRPDAARVLRLARDLPEGRPAQSLAYSIR
jgi:hypothetical protein